MDLKIMLTTPFTKMYPDIERFLIAVLEMSFG
jgi:hypothetical protein